MRLVMFLCGVIMMADASFAAAQTQQAAKPANAAAAVAPKEAKKYSTSTTTLGTLLEDPQAKAILVKYIPDFLKSDHVDQASGMTLKDLQRAVGPYAPDLFSDKVLAQIDQAFARLPSKK